MCDALQSYMADQKLTITDSTTTSNAYTHGLQCISKYKSNCTACTETPYTSECLYCLQFECSVTPNTLCCPKLKEAMACDEHLCRNNNTTKKSSLLLPIWAIIVLVIGSLLLLGFGLLFYYKSQIKSTTTKLF